jgi:hypothetical protein
MLAFPSRAIVEAERVVDGGDEMNAAAHHRDELAIARIAHAIDHVLGLVGRLCAGRREAVMTMAAEAMIVTRLRTART